MKLLHDGKGLILTIEKFGAHDHFIGLHIVNQEPPTKTNKTGERKYIDQRHNDAQDAG